MGKNYLQMDKNQLVSLLKQKDKQVLSLETAKESCEKLLGEKNGILDDLRRSLETTQETVNYTKFEAARFREHRDKFVEEWARMTLSTRARTFNYLVTHNTGLHNMHPFDQVEEICKQFRENLYVKKDIKRIIENSKQIKKAINIDKRIRIKELYREGKSTQRQIAEKVGVSVSTVNRYVKSKNRGK